MNLYTRFFVFQIIIISAFLAGTLLKNRYANLQIFAYKAIRTNLIFIEPPVILWIVWGLSISSKILYLPLFGLCIVMLGMGFGRLISHVFKFSGVKMTTFVISSGLANQGFTMGGFLCFLMLGETGLGYSIILTVYFLPLVFLIIFPFAKASTHKGKVNMRFYLNHLLNIQNMPLFVIIVGLIFHMLHIKRPEFEIPINAVIMISAAIYYFSMGVNFAPKWKHLYIRETVLLSLIKFILVPGTVGIVLFTAGISGTLAWVIMIQSIMPAAIYSVITAVLFKLDSELASEMMVLNTVVFLLAVMPGLFYIKHHFMF